MARDLQYRGSLSRRVKESPLLYQKIERGLVEASKNPLKEEVIYQNVCDVSSNVGAMSVEAISRFYLDLQNRDFLHYDNGNPIDRKKVEIGKKISEELEEMVGSFLIGTITPKKISDARGIEYRYLFSLSNSK